MHTPHSTRRTMLKKLGALTSLAIAAIGASLPAHADDKVLNIYSARHYPTDEALYSDFTKATGIRIQRVDADDAGILARLKAEGEASPADVILLVDAARLWRAEVDGLFQPIKSKLLDEELQNLVRFRILDFYAENTRHARIFR